MKQKDQVKWAKRTLSPDAPFSFAGKKVGILSKERGKERKKGEWA